MSFKEKYAADSFPEENIHRLSFQFGLINSLPSNVHRLSLSPYGLSETTSTVQNQIPYATGSRLLIGFTHQHGLGAVIGCSLQGPQCLYRVGLQQVCSMDRNSCLLHREPAGMCCKPGALVIWG